MLPPEATALAASVARLRWATLALLIVCAVVALLHRAEASSLAPSLETLVTPVSLALAVGIFVVRQIAGRATGRARVRALLATYLLSAALGVFGAFLALLGDDGSRGALFALGGAIFTVGTPPGLGLGAASLRRRS